jgi:glyoxylase-like metal-dependent hydrolase (beta-lactamase superfamily II)
MRPFSSGKGETLTLADGVTLVRLGGHYPGGTVLHWAAGADRRGALLSGDIIQVAMDPTKVSFMWSYPNMMPLSASVVRRIADTAAAWRFDRIYGAFPGRNVMADGNAVVERSAKRYIELISGR